LSRPLQLNDQVEASIRRLKAMGLKVQLIPMTNDWVVIAIDYMSILNYIRRAVTKAISYPKHFILLDDELKLLEVHLWRGDMPYQLMEKAYKK